MANGWHMTEQKLVWHVKSYQDENVTREFKGLKEYVTREFC